VIGFPGSLKIFLAAQPVDLRNSFDGLSRLTLEVIKTRPQVGSLYVFTNKKRNRIKILYWDRSGQWVMAKRLERGTFKWPRTVGESNGKISLHPEALTLLLDGIDLRDGTLRPWYQGA